MANHQSIHPEPIPQTLTHLITLNVEYSVLICIGNGCRCAVSPASISEHLRRKHHIKFELRQQVNRYIEGFPTHYDHSNVPLPRDGLEPQAIIKIVSGFQCKHCPIEAPFKTRSRDAIKKHGNKEHGKKRVADEELFDSVRLQSWFWEGKERYWIVDESKQPIQSSQPSQSVINDSTQSNDGQDDGSQDENDDQEDMDD